MKPSNYLLPVALLDRTTSSTSGLFERSATPLVMQELRGTDCISQYYAVVLMLVLPMRLARVRKPAGEVVLCSSLASAVHDLRFLPRCGISAYRIDYPPCSGSQFLRVRVVVRLYQLIC